MRYCHTLAVALIVLLFSVPLASAQSVAIWSLSGGGGTTAVTGGSFALTLGEPIVGTAALGDSTIAIGFWGAAVILGNTASVEPDPGLPFKYEIGTAYPNPFNPSTTIAISLPLAAPIRVDVYNVLGRRVTTLAEETLTAGVHKLVWNARGLASGVYFVRAEVPGKVHRIQKVVLVR